jgi:hypothetical protein
MMESRHHIKTRMLKNAARVWGYAETEAENNFDPLVSMLLAACSIELEKISGEIQASRSRVLERLVQLLSPDALTGALPAHAVACARSIETTLQLPEETQLFTHRRMPVVTDQEEPVWKDVFFSPTASFQVNKAAIRFMATGNQLYRVHATAGKEVIAHADAGKELPASTLWLGIDEPRVSLHDSLFYFDFRNEADKQLFYHQLPNATWWCNGQPLQHLAGYGERAISGEKLDIAGILNREDDVSGKIKKQVNALYKPFFIALYDAEGHTVKNEKQAVVPEAISSVFTGKTALAAQQQPLRWICVRFPETIQNRLLQDVVCMMNCFPVINRRLHDFNYRLQEVLNIIPLQTDDLFLDLEEVSDDENNVLNIRSFQKTGDGSDIALLMRNGGVGRFDERDGAAMVDYLLQLLRDESAAFSTLGNDFMNAEMKQLQQIMNKLEQRLFARQVNREETPYLVIRNTKKAAWRNLFIRYWSTTGTDGNNIKAGSSLQLYKGGGVEGNQAVLVTTTVGGRNKLGTAERVLAYKSALLSKDRLITAEDIKAFCHYQLGERVKNITIEKGIMVHPDQRKGFIKTLDVIIDINKKAFGDMEEKGELVFWTDNLKLMLEQKSPALLPYRIIIQQAA